MIFGEYLFSVNEPIRSQEKTCKLLQACVDNYPMNMKNQQLNVVFRAYFKS